MVICNAKIREQREKDKKLYSSIFNKMAENDQQVSEKNGGKWLYGLWDESTKGVQLDVDLAQIERDKQEAPDHQNAESTETPTESSHESSNDLRKCFRDSFLPISIV